MRIETKLFDEDGMTIFDNDPKKKKNPAFFNIDFDVLPKVGEMIIFHDNPSGIFVVISVAHEVLKNKTSAYNV